MALLTAFSFLRAEKKRKKDAAGMRVQLVQVVRVQG